MARHPNVYFAAFKASLQAKLEYRADLLVGMVTSILMQLAALSFLVIVLRSSPSIGGWSGAQILFLFGMTAACLGASELLFNQIWVLPGAIVMGDLDRLLTYPVNTLLFFLITRPELHAFGNLLTGVAYVAVSLSSLEVPWYAWPLLPLSWACGSLLYTSVLVIVACVSFRFLGYFAHHLMVPHNLLQAARYPLPVYPTWLRTLLLFGVPYASCTYLPGAAIFGKAGTLWPLLAAPLLTAVFVLLASRAWRSGLRYYESSGS